MSFLIGIYQVMSSGWEAEVGKQRNILKGGFYAINQRLAKLLSEYFPTTVRAELILYSRVG